MIKGRLHEPGDQLFVAEQPATGLSPQSCFISVCVPLRLLHGDGDFLRHDWRLMGYVQVITHQ